MWPVVNYFDHLFQILFFLLASNKDPLHNDALVYVPAGRDFGPARPDGFFFFRGPGLLQPVVITARPDSNRPG